MLQRVGCMHWKMLYYTRDEVRYEVTHDQPTIHVVVRPHVYDMYFY